MTTSSALRPSHGLRKSWIEKPFNREKHEKAQGEQERRDPSPRTDRRAIDVVTGKKRVETNIQKTDVMLKKS